MTEIPYYETDLLTPGMVVIMPPDEMHINGYVMIGKGTDMHALAFRLSTRSESDQKFLKACRVAQ